MREAEGEALLFPVGVMVLAGASRGWKMHAAIYLAMTVG